MSPHTKSSLGRRVLARARAVGGVLVALRARLRRRGGQALAEFAIILPVFLLMTLGVVDMARMFTAYISLTNGVREAAIFAGAGSEDAWCSSAPGFDAVPCPAGSGGHLDVGNDPWDSIAYRVQAEANGMDASDINLAAPTCASALSAGASFGSCDSIPSDQRLLVKIGATYDLDVLTPVLSAVLGGHIHLEATTVAAILR
jgi:hypothetical protein